jgi:hypothetical protein
LKGPARGAPRRSAALATLHSDPSLVEDPDDIGVALGIVPAARRGHDKLAVRIQTGPITSDRGLFGRLVKELEGRSHGECDIRQVGSTRASGTSIRPLVLGCSVAHYMGTAGTAGGFFSRTGHGNKRFILSNNHVLANEDRSRIGDVILQPGPADGGVLGSSQVGTLAAVVPLSRPGSAANVLNAAAINWVDAAICELDHDVRCVLGVDTHDPWIRSIRHAPLVEGDAVVKVGRTTRITRGSVSAIELDDLWVAYSNVRLRFDGQTEFEGDGLSQFAALGDSGAIVVDAERAACALLFAVSQTGGRNATSLAYANPINEVIKLLDLELIPPASGGPVP